MYSITGDYYARAMHPSIPGFKMCFLPYEKGLNFMARFLHSFDSLTIRKADHILLAFSWLLGLGAGGLVFRDTGDSIASLMRLAAVSQMSIVGLFFNILLPFLLSAFAVYIGLPKLLLIVCFGKAFTYAFVACGIFACYDGSGWLIRWLLLFSDSCSLVLLYGYAMRHISGAGRFSLSSFLVLMVGIGLLTGVDYTMISPFLRRLLL